MTGFEPATSRPPDARATKLRYIPMSIRSVSNAVVNIKQEKKPWSSMRGGKI